MNYYLDFDRTVFDTESFKRAFARRPTLGQLATQFMAAVREIVSPERSVSKRRIFSRMLGTFVSHRRFGFVPEEVQDFIYPDAAEFLRTYGKESTIVTYGVRAFITAKVANALTDYPLGDIVYTPRKKGPVLRRLIAGKEGEFVFVDDAHFQLESVGEACPEVIVIEIRRDGHEGDGRWPVIRSFAELNGVLHARIAILRP